MVRLASTSARCSSIPRWRSRITAAACCTRCRAISIALWQSNDRAQQLEPLWLAPKGAAGNFLYFARRYDESIRLLEQVLALDERADNARAFLIRNLIVKGDYDRAIAEYDKRPLQMPGSNAYRAQALALSGRRAAALVELDRVLKLSKERYVAAYDIALIYAALADTENTFLWLERAMEDRSTLINFLAQDPMFDAFHGDPRWAPLVQRIGIYRRVLPDQPPAPASVPPPSQVASRSMMSTSLAPKRAVGS